MYASRFTALPARSAPRAPADLGARSSCQDPRPGSLAGAPLACGRAQSGYTLPTHPDIVAGGAPTPRPGAEMLDAYIIDKIRRDREARERDQREQLRIDMPRPPAGVGRSRDWEAPEREDRDDSTEERGTEERGVVIVDFSL